MSDLPRLRRSTVESLLSCPSYSPSTSAEAAFGSLLHACIEDWTTDGDDPAEILARRFPGAGVHPDRQAEALDLLVRFCLTHDRGEDTLVSVEATLERTEPGLAVLTGTPDRLDAYAAEHGSGILITDYKSAWQEPDAEVCPFQLRFYAGLALAAYPQAVEVTLRLDHIRRNEGVAQWVFTRDEVEDWWRGTMQSLAAVLPLVGKERVGGAGCTYCGERWTCALSISSARQTVANDDEAAAAVEELIRLEAAVGDRKAALKAHMADRAPVVWHGREVGFRVPSSSTISLKDSAKPEALRLGLATEKEPSATFGLRKA